MRKDLFLVALLVSILALMIIPINQTIIDVLLAFNITLSVMLLMMAIYLRHSSDFSTFPSVILISTAFRLALSVATTRMILSEADAGQIIKVFGDFVVAGHVAIGLVMFLIVTVVQFLVVTKGAERVAEVGARFALDALPGKQMSIDADIRAGVLDAKEGEELRRRLDKDSQFFGAMDGAMKFVKGDAIAGLIIIAINLIGGIAIGVVTHEMSFGEAISVYSLLTIGDGLVAQIPALLMAMVAGVIVTRVASPDNVDLGTDIARELLADHRVTSLAAIVVGMVALIPGFPTLIFLGCSATLALTSLAIKRRLLVIKIRETEEEALAQTTSPTRDQEETVPGERPVEISRRLRVILGPELAAQLDMNKLAKFSRRNFEQFSETYGIQFPHVKIEVGSEFGEDTLALECDEVPVSLDTIPTDHILVRCEKAILQKAGCNVSKLQTLTWPDVSGFWVHKSHLSELSNMEVVPEDLEARISERIFRIYESNISILFSRKEFDLFMAEAEAVDAEAMSAVLAEIPRADVFQIVEYLIQDGVPLRPVSLFTEALFRWVQTSEVKTPVLIAECMRSSMRRQLCHAIAARNGILGLAMVDPRLEAALRQKVSEAKRTGVASAADGLILPAELLEKVLEQLHRLSQTSNGKAHTLVIVIGADLRRRLRNMLAANGLEFPVLSPHEISPDVNAIPIEMIRFPEDAKPTSPQRSQRRSRNRESVE